MPKFKSDIEVRRSRGTRAAAPRTARHAPRACCAVRAAARPPDPLRASVLRLQDKKASKQPSRRAPRFDPMTRPTLGAGAFCVRSGATASRVRVHIEKEWSGVGCRGVRARVRAARAHAA